MKLICYLFDVCNLRLFSDLTLQCLVTNGWGRSHPACKNLVSTIAKGSLETSEGSGLTQCAFQKSSLVKQKPEMVVAAVVVVVLVL